MTLNDVILPPDIAANIPAAASVSVGSLYFANDTNILYRSNGTSWDQYSLDYPVDLTADVTGVLPVANGGSGLSSGWCPVLKATTTLTDAQIKALPTTPITLIAAPGAGNFIKILGGTVIKDSAAGAYTNINTTYCAVPTIQYDATGLWATTAPFVNDSTLTTALTVATDLMGATAIHVMHLVAPGTTGFDAGATSGTSEWVMVGEQSVKADWENKAIIVQADNNGSGAFTGGNAANSMKIILYYIVEAF